MASLHENDGHPLYEEHELERLDRIGAVIIGVVFTFFVLYLGYHLMRWWLGSF